MRILSIYQVALMACMLFISACANTENQPTESAGGTVMNTAKQYEIVPNKLVCMVNDRFMGVDQIPIDVDGVTYFGCCENCVEKLQKNIDGVRFAVDPISGKKVDKANAVIVRSLADGVVNYFETGATAKKFLK